MRHEFHLTLAGMRVAVPIGAIAVAISWGVGGAEGAMSAALGAGLVVVNHLVAAASTGWARSLGPGVIGLAYSLLSMRLLAMFGAFAVLSQVQWIRAPLLAIAFCAVLVTSLAAECSAYAKGSYVPRWRMVPR